MFTQLKNIDTAFRHIRLFSYLLIAACAGISCYSVFKSYERSASADAHIYLLANGKVLEAFAADRKANVPVELRDHIRMFHEYFFRLSPDDQQIQAGITKALYLADGSAKTAYDNLREGNFYANLISGNISQEIEVDSVQLDVSRYPYYFKCFATEKLVRTSSTVRRSLVTQGLVRDVARSDNNPHGFLIERWETLENKDQASAQGPGKVNTGGQ